MKKATTLIVALATVLIALPAFADQFASCGWEDGVGDVLSVFGNVGSYANVGAPDPVNSGARSLTATESPLGGTPELYVAYFEGLTDGDVVDACYYTYDDTVGASPSTRIWAHYGVSGDVDSYNGSAGGNGTYSAGTGWEQQCFSWTFDSSLGTRDALIVVVRLYSDADGQQYWVDDLEVGTTSNTATITTPCTGSVSVDPSTWGQMKSAYR